jgi:hypothetical protein
LKGIEALFRFYVGITITSAVTETQHTMTSISTRIGPNTECGVVVNYLADFFKVVNTKTRAPSIIVGSVGACKAQIEAIDFRLRCHKNNKKMLDR